MITLFFALLNFAIFLSLCAYIGFTKVIPLIKKALAREHSEYATSKKDLIKLQQAEQSLRHALIAERQLAQELILKINQWQQALNKEREKQHEQLLLLQQDMIKRRQQQEYNWFLEQQELALLPEILCAVEQQARQKIDDPQVRTAYFAKLLESLQRNIV